MADIVNMISSLGFPMTMCIMLAWYIKTINQAYRDDIKAMQKSIDNNTAMMEKLIYKIDADDDDRR